MKTIQSYPFNDSSSSSKPSSTNGQGYIRSFVRDMLGDDLSEVEQNRE